MEVDGIEPTNSAVQVQRISINALPPYLDCEAHISLDVILRQECMPGPHYGLSRGLKLVGLGGIEPPMFTRRELIYSQPPHNQ